jgi:4-amino-4-deoxy-L-arabinose transferase-like glycosyltransferase
MCITEILSAILSINPNFFHIEYCFYFFNAETRSAQRNAEKKIAVSRVPYAFALKLSMIFCPFFILFAFVGFFDLPVQNGARLTVNGQRNSK